MTQVSNLEEHLPSYLPKSKNPGDVEPGDKIVPHTTILLIMPPGSLHMLLVYVHRSISNR